MKESSKHNLITQQKLFRRSILIVMFGILTCVCPTKTMSNKELDDDHMWGPWITGSLTMPRGWTEHATEKEPSLYFHGKFDLPWSGWYWYHPRKDSWQSRWDNFSARLRVPPDAQGKWQNHSIALPDYGTETKNARVKFPKDIYKKECLIAPVIQVTNLTDEEEKTVITWPPFVKDGQTHKTRLTPWKGSSYLWSSGTVDAPKDLSASSSWTLSPRIILEMPIEFVVAKITLFKKWVSK